MSYAIKDAISHAKFIGLDSSRMSLFGFKTPIVFKNSKGKEQAIDRGTLNQWIWGCNPKSPALAEYKKAAAEYDELHNRVAKAMNGFGDSYINMINSVGI